MNIPGLDAPSWSRISGNDEQQEEEEERQAEKLWLKQQEEGAQTVNFTPRAGGPVTAVSPPFACDLLVLSCGMLSSAFLATLLDGVDGAPAAASSAAALQELGRFTLTDAAPSAAAAAAPATTKQAKAEAARPYALVLSTLPGDASTVYGFNYLRASASQYFDITKALFERVAPKQVLLLDTMHYGSFISALRPVPCPPLLRRLQSSAFSSLAAAAAASSSSAPAASPAAFTAAAAAQVVPELEAPNLVYSYASSVLSQCEVSRRPAQLFVSMESRHYVLETLQAFEALFPALLEGGAGGLASGTAAPFRLLARSFLSSPDARRFSAYKSAIARVQRVYGYSAGQDSSMRETAGEVARDHQNDMFM